MEGEVRRKVGKWREVKIKGERMRERKSRTIMGAVLVSEERWR